MSKRQPQLMDMSRMRDIFMPHFEAIREHIWFSDELGIVHGDGRVFQFVIKQKPPFVINDHRLGIVAKGEADINVNLTDWHVTAGTLVYLGPGTIIHPKQFSSDLEVFGMALFADFPMPFAPDAFPPAYNGSQRDFFLHPDEADIQTARHIMDTIWHAIHQKNYHRPTVTSLVAALMHHYDALYRREAALMSQSRSREQTIFDRFIELVNQHCTEHRQLDYYAQRICLTQRYLGTVIRQTNGVTAKEWIDRALITRIKVELLHTDKSVADIAYDLGFANPAFFSKYFKRLTGLTPQKYREKE